MPESKLIRSAQMRSRSKSPLRSSSPPPAFKIKQNNLLTRTLQDPRKEIEIEEEISNGAKWIIDGKLRRVPPYYFTYLTFTKARWKGRELLNVFTEEFRDRDEAYYRKAIEAKNVFVNNIPATCDQILKDGDLISHRTHKHEQPVSSTPIKIVYEDNDLVVIDKPSGIPAHPTGRFSHNSISHILKYEHKIVCHPSNRLDRLTSGLMFLAKNSKFANRISREIRDREVQKEYLARVKGRFPLGRVVCEEPVRTFSPKVALNIVDKSELGKPCKTSFQRISYDGETSIVRCFPHTGRTHQIRVHLQFLGHPIANDPVYSNPTVWGESLGKGAEHDYEVIAKKLDEVGKYVSARSWINDEPGEKLSGEVCPECETPLATEPGPNDIELWLHSLRYSSLKPDGWAFETPIPTWVSEVHERYLDLALEEANKAEMLEEAFRVGCVIVLDGEIISTGYTRELEGNTHAEQNAITKYVAMHNRPIPEGSVLYCTMEPCTERLSGNDPCVNRILQSNIKSVITCVKEPNTFIKKNDGATKLEKEGVSYIYIPGKEEKALEIATKGHIKSH